MKQLKFMLAAATAFGIATAQAATEDLDNETFTYPDTQVVTEIDGFSFEGAAGDNESAIVNNALKVNTGTDPLLRQLNTKYKEAIDLTAEGLNSLSIDTKVKFTVTPEGDDVTATAGDKLMIYLKEVPEVKDGDEVVSAATTKLMVKAAKYSEADGAWVEGGDDYEVTLPQAIESVTADTWYRLIVKTKAYAYGFDDEGVANSWWPVFQIYLASATDDVIDDADLCKMGDVDGSGYGAAGIDTGDDEPDSVFVSLAVSAADGEGAGSSALSLTKVGFAGEGTIDDFVVTKDYVASSVDFTLALGEGVSAVQWTINDNDKTNADTFSATAGTTLNVAIKSVTYDAGYAGTRDWTAWTYSAAASGSIEITAEKFADVAADGTATPTDDTVKAVTEGAFKVPEATEGNAEAVAEAKADLAKALTWASSKAGKSYTAAIAAINGMTFDEDGDPSGTGDAKTNAEAYLLDCAANQNAIDEAMEDFVLTGFSIGADGAMTFGVGEDAKGNGVAYANGKIEVRGKAALNAANWVKDCPGATFFKAFLVK